MGDCDGDCMDDMVDIFEEFVKKSLFLVSITAGAIVIMVVYVLKVFSDRANMRDLSPAMPPLSLMQPDIQMQPARRFTPAAQMSPVKRMSPCIQMSPVRRMSSDTQMPPDTQELQVSSMSRDSESSSTQYTRIQPYGNVTQLSPPGYISPATTAASQHTRLISHKRIQHDISPQNSPRSSVGDTKAPSAEAAVQYPDDVLLNVKPSDYLPKTYYKQQALKQNIDELSPRNSYTSTMKFKKGTPTVNDSDDSQNKSSSENDAGDPKLNTSDDNSDNSKMNVPDSKTNNPKINSPLNNSSYSKINDSDDRAFLKSSVEQSNQNVRINIILENTDHGLEPKVTCTNMKMINGSKDSNQDQCSDKKFVLPTYDQQHQKIRINIKMETPEFLGNEPSNMRLLNAIYRDPTIENAESLKTKSSYYSAECDADNACKAGSDDEGNHSASNETTNALHSYDQKTSSNSTSPPQNNARATGKSRNTQTVEFLPIHYSDMNRSSKRFSNPNFGTCSATDYPPCTRSHSITYVPQPKGSCCSLCCEDVY